MRIELSESGHSKEWKPLKGLSASFAQMEDGPFGKGYFIIGTPKNELLASLLKKYDNTKELEFYFFNNILFMSIDSEPFIYTIEMFDENLSKFSEQIKKDKKILVAILGENKVETLFLNNIII